MLTFSSPPRLRLAALLGAAVLVVAVSAHAQQTPSLSHDPALSPDSAAPSPTESSSSTPMLADDPNPAPSAVPASGAAAQSGSGSMSHGFFSHLAAEAGGGGNTPVGNGGRFLTWGGNFNVGGGMHFNKAISLLAEYQFVDDKLPGTLIADAGAQGGYAHIWSLTLDPVIDLMPSRTNSAYVTGGGGFYRKVTSFTDPQAVYECYYFCGVGYENVVVSHFSSNQWGANAGMGLTHKLAGTYGDGTAKLFAEARFVYVDTPSIGTRNGLGVTELVPVTLGVRW